MKTLLDTITEEALLDGEGFLPPIPFFSRVRFIVDGKPLKPPAGLSVTNFLDPSVQRFSRTRRTKSVGQIIIHETGGSGIDPNGVFTFLRDKRGLSVHMIGAPDGSITQHGDLVRDVLKHAGKTHNKVSVGIEVMNPYYPSRLKSGRPWKRVIPAKWAHKGRYVLPTPQQRPPANSSNGSPRRLRRAYPSPGSGSASEMEKCR